MNEAVTRTSRPTNVTLDETHKRVDAQVRSLRQQVQEALDDPRPSIPADKVFAQLQRHHAERVKASLPD